jgi:hypothetical protein
MHLWNLRMPELRVHVYEKHISKFQNLHEAKDEFNQTDDLLPEFLQTKREELKFPSRHPHA